MSNFTDLTNHMAVLIVLSRGGVSVIAYHFQVF